MLKMGSQTHSTGGMINMLMTAEIRAPRASIMQMELMISISEIVPTPRVAQNSTRELVMMEASEEVAAMRIESRNPPWRPAGRSR